MKRLMTLTILAVYLSIVVCIGQLLSAQAFASTLDSEPYILWCEPADIDFYAQCFDHARQNMPNPERSDPEVIYRQQAEYANAMPESVRKRMAKANQLWGLADDTVIPRDEAQMIAYAALDSGEHVKRDELHRYYADAWYNISDPTKPIWQVHVKLANTYATEEGRSNTYVVYVDAQTGEVVDIQAP